VPGRPRARRWFVALRSSVEVRAITKARSVTGDTDRRPAGLRRFPHDATAAAFLLGGIGTGNVSVGARGEFRDWELFNGPAKGNELPYSFFALRTQLAGRPSISKVLEAELQPPHDRSHGYYPGSVAGLPRFSRSTMQAGYPFVWVDLADDDIPVTVSLEAFTPFIPLDPDDSGLPGATIRYHVANPGSEFVDVSVVGSLANAAGFAGHSLFFDMETLGRAINEYRAEAGLRGLLLRCEELSPQDLRYGSLVLATTDGSVTSKPTWLHGYWWDGIQDLWDDFSSDGRLEPVANEASEAGPLAERPRYAVGSIALQCRLPPGGSHVFEFILTWHFPNRPRAWGGHIIRNDPNADQIETNYYASRFADAWEVARYLVAESGRLERTSRLFQETLFSTTLPPAVIDAVAANITVMRSTTCFRIADGTLVSWEGTFNNAGSCEGSCTHVWNYAQTMASFFPILERSMRRVEFLDETDAQGRMAFRSNTVFAGPRWDMLAAVDGQLGTIVRLYRDWRISGDDVFLRELWPSAKRTLSYAAMTWDADGDGVLDGQKHNTYDVEFFGVDPLANSMWLAALAAAEAMATAMGEPDEARRYGELRGSAATRIDERLFNGEYYVQDLADIDAQRYQFGQGCLADQVFGALMARIVGLGDILPAEHVRSALRAIHRHNFRSSFRRHANVQRTYALNDEAGLLLCTWPRGGRPRFPFVYADEVWPGVEYQVAAHLIFAGDVTSGLEIVQAVRARHDGYRRNPWNEVECGNHYVRSMASWAVYQALCGISVDAPNRRLFVEPAIEIEDFSAFVIAGDGWGVYRERRDPATGDKVRRVDPLYGSLHLELTTAPRDGHAA
jgi:non-lysosomal glucosylceramidase